MLSSDTEAVLRLCAYLLSFSVVLGTPALVQAQASTNSEAGSKEKIRRASELFLRGVAASEASRWEEAEAAFAESAALVPSANCLLNLAVARFRLNRPVAGLSAIERFEALSVDPKNEQVNRARLIRTRLEALRASRVLKVSPSHADVFINGKRVPSRVSPHALRLDPGTHVLTVSADGYLASKRQIETLAGTTGEIEIVLAPAPSKAAAALQGADAAHPQLRNESITKAHRDQPARKSERPVWASPWLWVGVGVVAAAAAATAIVLSQSSEQKPVPASEGIVVEL